MSPARRSSTRRKRKRGLLACWWPLLLGLAVAPFAVRGASLLALSGPFALRLLFPFVSFVQTHWTASYAAEQREVLAQWAMWAQFPLYGLLASLIGSVSRVARGVFTVLVVHVAAICMSLLLAH